MKLETAMIACLLGVGAAVGLVVGFVVTGDIAQERADRDLVKAGFAYYTNSPSGYPVLVFKEVKP